MRLLLSLLVVLGLGITSAAPAPIYPSMAGRWFVKTEYLWDGTVTFHKDGTGYYEPHYWRSIRVNWYQVGPHLIVEDRYGNEPKPCRWSVRLHKVGDCHVGPGSSWGQIIFTPMPER